MSRKTSSWAAVALLTMAASAGTHAGDCGILAARYDSGEGSSSVAQGDLNGDGKIDLVVANVLGYVSVLLNKGDGSFAADVRYGTGGANSVTAGDLNGDGGIDLAVANWGTDDVSVLMIRCGACPADLDGSGARDFGDIRAILIAWGPCDRCPEDLDGSGTVDFGDLEAMLSAWGPCPWTEPLE